MPDTCRWVEEPDGEYFESKCGEAFSFGIGGPIFNKWKYCPYCGKIIYEMPYKKKEKGTK